MKCKRLECQKEAPTSLRGTHMVYCSKDCAPYGRLGELSTRSPRPGLYTSKVAGVPLKPFLKDESFKTKSGEKSTITTQLTERRSSMHTASEENETSSVNAREIATTTTEPVQPESANGSSSIPEISKPGLPVISGNLSTTNDSTQLMAFIAPLPSSEEARSPSTNLIDSSLQHLHSLMKDIAKDAAPNRRLSPEMVNAVCNVSKQMRDLMKLKIDVVQMVRKNSL